MEPDGERLRRRAQRRARYGRFVARIVAAEFFVIVVGLTFCLAWLLAELGPMVIEGQRLLEEANGPMFLFAPFIAVGVFLGAIALLLALPAAYVVFYSLPALISLPLILPGILAWRTPARILVLRRFGRRDLSRSLRRVIGRDVAGFGHVYTLGDPHIRVRWFVRFPLLVGQVAFLTFRHRRVRSAYGVRRLLHYTHRTTRRNLNWYMSQRKIWPLRCSDEVWRQCVEALASDADVILIDVSDISDHLRWELALCRDRELLDRVVPLVSQEHQSAVEREFAQGLDGIRLPKPYVYGPKSLVDLSGFLDEVALIVARGRATRVLLQEPSLGGAVLARTFGWLVLALAGQLVLGLLLDRTPAGVVLATFAASIAPLLVCS